MNSKVASVSRETLQIALQGALAQMGLGGLDGARQSALLDYLDLLVKWNKVYNLTAVRDPMDMLTLHVLDSLSVQHVMRDALDSKPAPGSADEVKPRSGVTRILDMGAGAGLPGIVLAIMNPDWQITLVDAVQKKVAFITQAIAQLKLGNAQARHGRIEHLTFELFDAVVSRAFSDLDLFSSLAVPHLHAAGHLFAMQGKADDRLIAPFTRKTLHRLCVPGLDAHRHLLILDR